MIYIISMACMTGTLSAQTVVDYSTFEQKVLDYSQTLKNTRWILAEWLFLWSTIHTVPK